MRRYVPYLAVISGAYAVNRFCLIPLTGWRVLSCYAADFLAGGMMLCVLNGALETAGRPPVLRALPVSAFCIACGLFWEYVTPLYLTRSVSDPWDIAAAWLGGMVMRGWLRKES